MLLSVNSSVDAQTNAQIFNETIEYALPTERFNECLFDSYQ